jgi:hypothetical protein
VENFFFEEKHSHSHSHLFKSDQYKLAMVSLLLFQKRSRKKTATLDCSQNSTQASSQDFSKHDAPSACGQHQSSAVFNGLPVLIRDLRRVKNTSGDKANRILKKLVWLSGDSYNNRTEIIRLSDYGTLLPTLLDFLARCDKGAKEKSLALLVVNNLCKPVPNKRVVSAQSVKILCQMLCDDPSCHLLGIILVNLIADADVRKDFVRRVAEIKLVESLSFALRVASFTREEYARLQPRFETKSATELLTCLLEEDLRRHTELDPVPILRQQVFPETVRWTLAVMQHLTRPSKDARAAFSLIKVGIVPHILNLISISTSHSPSRDSRLMPAPLEPECVLNYMNAPISWDAHSAQDAALFVVMNMAAVPAAREYIRELDCIRLFEAITNLSCKDVPREILEIQRLKARMALAYLIGSEGHFGQAPSKYKGCFKNDVSALIVTDTDVIRIVELLATALHRRIKEAATFRVKDVVFAIRCLLTQNENRVKFAHLQGTLLNALLIKVLAHHSVLGAIYVDAKTAEHACFSLYLMSNHCFQKHAFLPQSFAVAKTERISDSPCAKILTAYQQERSITAAGKHASDQLLLRLKYLHFGNKSDALTILSGSCDVASDFKLEKSFKDILVDVRVGAIRSGARPDKCIFEQPVLRREIEQERGDDIPLWDDSRGAVKQFVNALEAAQDLSFASTRVRHLQGIDDVLIANNIVHCANGDKTESYNFMWSWQGRAFSDYFERENSPHSMFSVRKTEGSHAFDALFDNVCGVGF